MISTSRRRRWRPHDAALGWAEPTATTTAVLLTVILLLAAVIRLHGLPHDLPYSYFTDEMTFVNRAMAMGSGDLNPRWFNKPALLMYLLLACYGALFAVGWLLGQFASPEAFGAYFLAGTGPFVLIGRLVVLAFGVAAVYATYLLSRRAFGGFTGALCAALLAAVLLPMVVGSYLIKADVPAGLFVALSAWAYLRTREDASLRPVLLAGAFAGLAMGTKYYGIILLPVFGLAELARPFSVGERWARVVLRGALLGLAFVAAFFAVAPYNFLDPAFTERIVRTIGRLVAADGAVDYAIDSQREYTVGLGTTLVAMADSFRQLPRWDALTWPVALLAGLGIAATLARRETRWAAFVLATPCVIFVAMSGIFAPFHTDSRHLNAIYPLLLAFVFPGAHLLVRLARPLPGRLAARAAAVLVLPAAAWAAYLTVAENLTKLRPDSRTVAAQWLQAHLPRDERILLDDYGPSLAPGPAAVARLQARLDEVRAHDVGAFDAFTAPEAQRLALLARHPIADGFNVDRLGHPWWAPRELSEAELLSDPGHRRVSNPLVSRTPKTLEEYRADGVRYVVSNTIAECRYVLHPNAAADFPSFARFYGELRALRPTAVFDPREWDGKGPAIFIYDLEKLDDPAATDANRPLPACDVENARPGAWPGEYVRDDLPEAGATLAAAPAG